MPLLLDEFVKVYGATMVSLELLAGAIQSEPLPQSHLSWLCTTKLNSSLLEAWVSHTGLGLYTATPGYLEFGPESI